MTANENQVATELPATAPGVDIEARVFNELRELTMGRPIVEKKAKRPAPEPEAPAAVEVTPLPKTPERRVVRYLQANIAFGLRSSLGALKLLEGHEGIEDLVKKTEALLGEVEPVLGKLLAAEESPSEADDSDEDDDAEADGAEDDEDETDDAETDAVEAESVEDDGPAEDDDNG